MNLGFFNCTLHCEMSSVRILKTTLTVIRVGHAADFTGKGAARYSSSSPSSSCRLVFCVTVYKRTGSPIFMPFFSTKPAFTSKT